MSWFNTSVFKRNLPNMPPTIPLMHDSCTPPPFRIPIFETRVAQDAFFDEMKSIDKLPNHMKKSAYALSEQHWSIYPGNLVFWKNSVVEEYNKSKDKNMNVAETMVVALLKDLQKNQAKVQSFITARFIPADMKKIIEEIEKILGYLKPIIDEIDSLIPASMPELKLVFDWAVAIINAMPS